MVIMKSSCPKPPAAHDLWQQAGPRPNLWGPEGPGPFRAPDSIPGMSVSGPHGTGLIDRRGKRDGPGPGSPAQDTARMPGRCVSEKLGAKKASNPVVSGPVVSGKVWPKRPACRPALLRPAPMAPFRIAAAVIRMSNPSLFLCPTTGFGACYPCSAIFSSIASRVCW